MNLRRRKGNLELQNYDFNCGMVVNIIVEVNVLKYILYNSWGGDFRLVEIKSNLNL